MSSEKSKVMVYACGGLGTNIIAKTLKNESIPGIADTDCCFVDTSRANLTDAIPDDRFYHVTGEEGALDGSGGVRSTNANFIVKHAKQIISKFKPEWLNVVIASGSGGSGSVVLPVIAGELLAQGHNVVVVVVGSRASSQRATNTVRTLQSLEQQAINGKRPLVMSYIDSPMTASRAEVDKETLLALSRILVLASRDFRELDKQDIINFFDYSRVPACRHLTPMLVSMTTFTERTIGDCKDNVISIASIYRNEDMPAHNILAAYDTHGYGPAPTAGEQALHYVLSAERLGTIYRDLDGMHQKAQEEITKVVVRDSIIKDVKPSEGGLILD